MNELSKFEIVKKNKNSDAKCSKHSSQSMIFSDLIFFKNECIEHVSRSAHTFERGTIGGFVSLREYDCQKFQIPNAFDYYVIGAKCLGCTNDLRKMAGS